MIDKFIILFAGVSVIEAQVSLAAVLLCYTEVESDCFGMADVKVAVGLWRESRHDPAASGSSVFSKDFSRVSSINVTSNQCLYVYGRLFISLSIFFLDLCWFGDFLLFGICGGFRQSCKSLLFLFLQNSVDNASISPLVNVLHFCYEKREIKVVSIFVDLRFVFLD